MVELDQKLPDISDVEFKLSDFELSSAEKARAAEIDAIILKRTEMNISEVFT